jgi:phosphoribosylamine---glycine ligase
VKILIVGNGGREHALLWKLARDAPEATFSITGGNGGTSDLAEPLPISPTDIEALAEHAAREGIDLTVVGPEGPLAAGIVNRFAEEGLPVFGPSAAAARIESSKAYAKALMTRHGVPTAAYRAFQEASDAERYIREQEVLPVVKASGLAAGKGAVVPDSVDEAVRAARDMLSGEAFGAAGGEIVVEERMEGEELSVFALCDGERAVPLLPSQDHKRVGEGDVGPNTGGMGAYAPVSLATAEVMELVQAEILDPVVSAMAADGRPFRGLLYAGIMLTTDGPKVVEFNCRFGDPETQVVLPLLESSLLDPLLAVARGERLEGWTPAWSRRAAVTTVVASEGYPGDYPRGRAIKLTKAASGNEDVLVFHAGTRMEDDRLVTSGGRVLAVTGLGDTLAEAAERSRKGAEAVRFEGAHFRRDIGWREMERAGAVSSPA